MFSTGSFFSKNIIFFISTIDKIISVSIALENTTENQAIINSDETTHNSTIDKKNQDLNPLKPGNQQETNSIEDTTEMIDKGG